jgi:hypothetical protein
MIKNHYIEIAAIFISILALSFTIYQGYVTRKHNRISVEPILAFTSGFLTLKDTVYTDEYKISIKNNGLGPALIKSFDVYIVDDPITSEKYEVGREDLLAAAGGIATIGFTYKFIYTTESFGNASVLDPNTTIDLLKWDFNANEEIKHNIMLGLRKINIRIQYTSLYKDKVKEIFLGEKDFSNNIYPPFNTQRLIEIKKKYLNSKMK